MQEVPSADETVKNVRASHLTILGLIMFFMFKLCGKKNQPVKDTTQNEEQEKIDDLINSIQ